MKFNDKEFRIESGNESFRLYVVTIQREIAVLASSDEHASRQAKFVGDEVINIKRLPLRVEGWGEKEI